MPEDRAIETMVYVLANKLNKLPNEIREMPFFDFIMMFNIMQTLNKYEEKSLKERQVLNQYGKN